MKNDEYFFGFAESVHQSNLEVFARFDMFRHSDWNRIQQFRDSLSPLDPEVPVFLLELTLKLKDVVSLDGLNGRRLSPRRWYRVNLAREGRVATIYRDPQWVVGEPVRVGRIDFLDHRRSPARELETIISLNGIEAAEPAAIEGALSVRKPTNQYVTCYNVGQGNCNAICDERGRPVVYFDFGGGFGQHARTYPANMKFCFAHSPPIVLSHWDKDHWYSATKFPAALNSYWIAPRQHPIGLSHQQLALSLHQNGRLLLWPQSRRLIRTRLGSLVKLPNHRRHNYSGIVMYARTSNTTGQFRTLLPGDAPYRRIPRINNYRPTGLVTTHHGGDYAGDTPPRAASPYAAALSYGQGNYHKHPSPSALRKLAAAGWSHVLHTTGGTICLATKTQAVPLLPCQGKCTLQPRQV